ncbi:MAG: Nif3-like dinuclear metal center hexameric protein, partial [Lachnospiraceae bacterium]
MKCRDIIKVLEKVAPEKIACSWDNVGLLIGRRDKNVSKILITLDVTDEVIEQAMQEQVDMIISHHPLLFKPISNVNSDTVIGRRLIRLLGSDISYYAMHT